MYFRVNYIWISSFSLSCLSQFLKSVKWVRGRNWTARLNKSCGFTFPAIQSPVTSLREPFPCFPAQGKNGGKKLWTGQYWLERPWWRASLVNVCMVIGCGLAGSGLYSETAALLTDPWSHDLPNPGNLSWNPDFPRPEVMSWISADSHKLRGECGLLLRIYLPCMESFSQCQSGIIWRSMFYQSY